MTTSENNQKIEVIVAAYNNLSDLQLVLEGYLRQTDKAFNLCIADDGSDGSIKALVELYALLGLKIRHIWQPDNGFRKARIINRAVATSDAKFIIFSDGDCIPSRYYIADYRHYLTDNTILIGRRVDMYDAASRLVRAHHTSLSALENPFWLLYQAARRTLKRPEIGIRLPKAIIDIWNRKVRGAIGANMAMPREAFMTVNGYDADFEGYGMEETDLVYRLNQSGYKNQTVLGRCALFHLYHPEKQLASDALDKYRQKRQQNCIRCKNGIDQIREDE